MSLHCLVYTSVASLKFSDQHLRELLLKARANNHALGITGMLLYLDPYFIQILEGTETAVSARFDIIKRDARHTKLRLMYNKPVDSRAFPNWTMGFNKINDETLKTVEGFADFWQRQTNELFNDSPNETEKVLIRLLDRFKDETLF